MKNFNGYKIIKCLIRDEFLILNTFGEHVLFMGDCADAFPEIDMLVRAAVRYKDNEFRKYAFNNPYHVYHKFKKFEDLEETFPEYLL